METILSRFLKNTEKVPDTIAIWADDLSFTFRELNDHARRVARTLQEDGVGAGDVVTIELPRSREYLGTIMGVWMLGAVYVPSDDSYPQERKDYIARDSGARVRVDPDYLRKVGADRIDTVHTDFRPEDIAFITYTSGSTGRPKGVVISHLAASDAVDRTIIAADLLDTDTFASPAAFTFIAGMIPMLATVSRGVSLFVVPNEARVNLVRLADFTCEHRITHTFMAPAMVPYFKQKERTLRKVFVGGERASNVFSDEFEIINNYGSTESCALVTTFRIDRPYPSTPLGTPVGNVNVYLLDENGKEAEEGEICFTGNLATGYRNLPEATARTFVPNPFADRDGFGTMVRTGDIGRRLPDGNLVFLERRDWMVNINGQRVEPAEIASALTEMPQVVQAFVKDFEGSDGQTFLCGYYRLVAPVSEEVIRQHLESRLPRYMIPAYLMRMEAMPLNSSGKIDRSQLPNPRDKKEAKSAGAEMDHPENRIVKGIREELESASGRGDYGYDEDLMRCGVSSLAAIRFSSGIMDRFGVSLEVTDMLSGCSIRSIEARIIDSMMERLEDPHASEGQVMKEKNPLTKSQLGVFGECYSSPDSVTYNIPFAADFPKKEGVDRDAVVRAIESVVDAHFTLKSTVAPDEEGVPSMFPHPDAPVRIEVLSGDEGEYDSCRRDFVRPFDLSESLYHITVFETERAVRCLFDFHHIMFDGSSAILFRQDLKDAVEGRRPEAERYSMYDVAEKESALAGTEEYESAGGYFAELLSGTEGATLPPRDVVGDEESKGEIRLACDRLDRASVERFVKSQGVSEDAFFQAVMGFTLCRFTYSEESCFTTVHSGRNEGRTNHLVGMLVKTLPVVCRPDPAGSPRDLVREISSQFIESRRNDIYPFTEIATRLGVSTDVMFVYQAIFDKSLVEDALEIGDIKNRFSVQVMPSCDGYEMDITYDASMYSEEFIRSFGNSYALAARGFLGRGALRDISLLDERAETVLDAFNRTEKDYDRSQTPVDLLRTCAREDPEHEAVVHNDRRLKYRELDEVTDRLACLIAQKGIGRDSFVAVMTGRNVNGFIAPWGVAKAGAGYQPLDPSYPVDRLEFMLQDSSARMLILDRDIPERIEGLKEIVEGFRGTVLYTDEIPSLPAGTPPAGPSPRDAAVILYTSGTTGKPKGCVIEHAQATAFLQTFRERVQLGPDARFGQYASFGFDAGFTEIFLPIACGSTVHILDDSIRSDVKAMERYFNDNALTAGFMTTQVGRLFIETAKVPSLRAFLVGGEKLVPVTPSGDVEFYDAYGPSETLAFVASHRVVDDRPMQPVGRPNHNTRLYIVDRDLNRLPVGAVGELCIAGLQVSRGYLNRPEKNEECFVTNPFTKDADYQRMYRTGDVARILPDGSLGIVGRSDGQVKIRGFRIELGEIEKVIREFPGIRDATVQAFDAAGGGKFVAAYVVSDSPVDIQALNGFILQTKPPYMVPAVTLQIDSIPLTVNSKVDKRRLPAPVMDVGEVLKPATELQERIHAVVAKVIGTSDFGTDTDLFSAGLTSIGSIRLNVLMSDEFGIPFQTRDIRDNPTVLRLEEFIGRSAPARTYAVQDDYPLTKTQEGIYIECLSRPGSTAYNIPLLISIDPSLDRDRLKESIVKAVDAHPFMMTSLFQNDSGEARFRHTDPGMFTVSDIEEIECERFEDIKGDLLKPFDLFGPRLMRVKLIHAEREYLLVEMHHIISDGTSVQIFVDTVSRIYNGEEVTPEKFSGFEASLREQEDRSGDSLKASREYYENLLSGSDRDFLPKGDVYHPDPAAPNSLDIEGAKGLAGRASAFCEDNRVSMNGLMCAAFGYVLSGYNGSDHSVFTTVYNGRNDSSTAYSVSMFVKTLPVVCTIGDRTRSPATLTGEISRQLVDSMSNDLYSFSEISRDLDVKADVLFVYQGDEFIFDSFCGRPAEMVEISLSDEKEPILFQVLKIGDTFRYLVEYDSARFTSEFIGYLTRSFDNAVSEFITRGTLDDIDLTDDTTLELVRRVNSTDVPFDRTRTVVDDFVDNARRDPDHVAVVCSDESITYGELDRISDHIAGYIRDRGIGTDQFVGVLVPRCISMVTCAEGVLKSGAAYQPLDPTYPEERLQFMLEDSRVRLLIADRSLLDKVPRFNGDILCLDEIPSLCEGERPDLSGCRPSQKDAMIILYTSGTTGTPKGCVLEHGNLMSYLNWMRPEVGLGPDSVYASYASYGFDACMMDIHASMTSGAEMHIIPEEMRKDLADIDRYFDVHRVTHGFMTTQMGRMFMENTRTRSLKAFMAGGEALVPLTPPSWVDFYNIYGPTECTVNVTTFIVRDDSPLLPIGRPNSNVRLYVLDRQDRIVPAGHCGELCISGPQVFREYLNNPEKTAMTVVRNPYGDCPEHSRLYRTGDVVRLLPDGNIDYIGRRDGMVKVRGFRIELGEVEKAIRDHPAVTNATVTAVDNPAGGKSLVAYFVTDKGVTVQELKDFIRQTKPPYMVPSHFIRMDSIPVNVNGKVDRRRLPAPSMDADRKGREPSGEIETRLCQIFGTVLGADKVYADDDFFEIGGTSISASKLVMNCMNAGFPLVFKNVFDNPTPEALARFIVSQKDVKVEEEHREQCDTGPLAHNVVQELGDMSTAPLGRVLLTGATGFLGSHVLHELLDKGVEHVICLVRSGKGQDSEQRIRTVFNYYFGGLIDEEVLGRITAVDSDITDPQLESRLEGLEFDTVINCAAVVKHFAADDSIERVNVGGVKNLISVAMKRGCRLVQISTESVAGESVNGHIPETMVLREDMLDFGQNIDNKYVNSKFKAEAEIIKAMSEGLRAKIIRVGNLMSRDSDGEFQINSATNAFMNQIKAYTKIGCISVTDLDSPVEFSPIDKVAEAVVLLAGTPDKFTVFHLDNSHKVHMANVIKVLSDNNLGVSIVPPEEFRQRFMEILADDTRNQYVAGLISYMGNAGESRRFIRTDNTFTVKALYMLGFSWPIISEQYIDKAIRSLKALRFFR
ncbi:MAG: amino acid adenylation domain-containing protein [archaeon]|nr:amino acid adenylation domain-containing protein [archaeon]